MILSSDKSPVPTVHVQVPPAIHVHASEVAPPTINVQPAELKQTIEVQPAELNPTINVAAAPPEIVIQPHEPRTWKFEVRDETGRVTKTIIATPQ